MPSVASFLPLERDAASSASLDVSPLATPSIFNEFYTPMEDLESTLLPLSGAERPILSRYQLRRLNSIRTDEEDDETVRISTDYSNPSSSISSVSSSPSEDEDYHATRLSSSFNCLNECAVDLSAITERSLKDHVLDFDVVLDDGGYYSTPYNVENILRNDHSVYCSRRSGAINIMLRYCGRRDSHGFVAGRSCVLSQIVIKSPQHGFTAPCKDGMVFMSHTPIDIERTSHFDHFTKHDYERYVAEKTMDSLEDTDPVAWFSVRREKQGVVELNDRSGKYVLIKLLRAENESENIDLQYVGLIGYSGALSFARAPKLC